MLFDLTHEAVAHVLYFPGHGVYEPLFHTEKRIGLVGHAEIQQSLFAHIEDAEIHLLFRKALVEALAYGRHVNLAVVTVRIGHLAGVFRHTRVLVLCHPEPVNRSVSGQRGGVLLR